MVNLEMKSVQAGHDNVEYVLGRQAHNSPNGLLRCLLVGLNIFQGGPNERLSIVRKDRNCRIFRKEMRFQNVLYSVLGLYKSIEYD